jgi:hypothetical protein
MKKILTACLQSTNTDGEYQYSESNAAEYGEEWDGDVLGYVDNLELDESISINGEYDGSIHNLPADVVVLVEARRPITIYWATEDEE